MGPKEWTYNKKKEYPLVGRKQEATKDGNKGSKE
jgi:hypothetical protein